MSTGLGKTAIIASAIDKILEKHDKEQKILIAVLTSQRAICEQIKNVLVETNPHFNIALYIKEMIGAKILITTYQDVRKNQLEIKNFDLIICDEAPVSYTHLDVYKRQARKRKKMLTSMS